jgi:hypothetical protein
MNTRHVSAAVLALFATAALAAAQDKTMPMDKKMSMDKKMEHTLTGCVARSDSGVFTLDHAMAPDTMKKESMSKDTMMKDSMMAAPELASKTVDLSKHVGHKVTVTGSDDTMSGKTTFTVKSLKMVAQSCS